MPYFIVGLGNPGEKYETTRHNTGRMVVEAFAKMFDFEDFQDSKKLKGLVSEGKIGQERVTLLLPETFMNKSGQSVMRLVTSVKKAKDLVVVYDDLDLPLGTMKLSFNRGSGGHNGIESIARALKTKAYGRLRMGISPATPSGKTKKPQGDKKVMDFIIGEFKKHELEQMKKIAKQGAKALEQVISEGLDRAMGSVNSR